MLSLIFLGTKLVEEKPSEVRTVYIHGSAFLSLQEPGLTFGKLSQRAKQLLAKSKHD